MTNSTLTVVGSKKAVEAFNSEATALERKVERTKFQKVAAGICPHDGAPLLEPVKTKGVGLKLVCSQCSHTWYINKKIKTCGCLTCRGTQRNSTERANSNRIEIQSAENNSGPFWTRTRDPSLIR